MCKLCLRYVLLSALRYLNIARSYICMRSTYGNDMFVLSTMLMSFFVLLYSDPPIS